jgi:hypothetical protein
MSTDKPSRNSIPNRRLLTVDTWAVIIGLVLALAVRFGIFKNVPW